MDLSSQAMERVDAIYQTESYSELESIPDFFFLISVKVVHLTQDVPGNGAVNKWFVAIQDYPVNPKQTDYTYKNLIQDLLDKEVVRFLRELHVSVKPAKSTRPMLWSKKSNRRKEM